MQLEVGKIYDGKVTGITKFGAFVELCEGTVGMVHISEVSPTYVNDISEHLKEKQEVKVKVLNIGEDGKISLSIKRAMPRPQNNNRNFSDDQKNGGRNKQNGDKQRGNFNRNQKPQSNFQNNQKQPTSFEDMLSKFMSSSDEKFSDMKKPESKRRGNNHNRKNSNRDFDY